MNRRCITVGSLVRHMRTGGIGLVMEHTMWDGDWGAYKVQFMKPVGEHKLSQVFDRADRFELVYIQDDDDWFEGGPDANDDQFRQMTAESEES